MDYRLALLIAFFIAAYVAMQFWLLFRSRNQQGRPVPRLDDHLDAKYLAQPRLILYFWRPGCQICGQTSMIVEPLLGTRRDIVSLNVLEHQELARRFRIAGTPALIAVADGRITRVLTGSRSEAAIRNFLEGPN